MNIQARILNTRSQPLHTITVGDSNPGLTPGLIALAETEVLEWAAQQGMRVITDTFSQGDYRAWVEPTNRAGAAA